MAKRNVFYYYDDLNEAGILHILLMVTFVLFYISKINIPVFQELVLKWPRKVHYRLKLRAILYWRLVFFFFLPENSFQKRKPEGFFFFGMRFGMSNCIPKWQLLPAIALSESVRCRLCGAAPIPNSSFCTTFLDFGCNFNTQQCMNPHICLWNGLWSQADMQVWNRASSAERPWFQSHSSVNLG